MDHEIRQRILDTLRDIRSGQRDILAALARQRRVTLVAMAGILACIGAIGWILLRCL